MTLPARKSVSHPYWQLDKCSDEYLHMTLTRHNARIVKSFTIPPTEPGHTLGNLIHIYEKLVTSGHDHCLLSMYW